MTSQEMQQQDWFDWAESFLGDWKARDAEWDESFSLNAARVIVLAGQAARSLDQDYVGAEHLLAAMLKLNSGAAAAALKDTGLTLAFLKNEIESSRGTARPKKVEGVVPCTPRCKSIITKARSRARGRGVRVEVEDLLMEILTEKEGLPARIFRERAIDVKKIENRIGKDPLRR